MWHVYFAAVAQELGDSRITAVDLTRSESFEPNIEMTSKRIGLSHLIDGHREASLYTWSLKHEIEP